mmetsp:Transcript_39621/g.122506  ORF Transcript_39621/g.122506 Transcript_39621/m.122506 type:complete len:503 (-) Transcript_39621:437-1945(-)
MSSSPLRRLQARQQRLRGTGRRGRRGRRRRGEERMAQGLRRGQAPLRLVRQQALQKVEEVGVGALHERREALRVRPRRPPARVRHELRRPGGVKEDALARGAVEHRTRRQAEGLHDQEHLLVLALAGEQRVPVGELCEHAAERPHVDLRCVRNPEQNLGRAVETRLDVRVQALAVEARGAEIDDAQPRFGPLDEEDVLGLQVAVHDVLAVREDERLQHLPAEVADRAERHRGEAVGLVQVVEALPVQLERDHHVVAELEVRQHPDDVGRAVGVLAVQMLEDFHLDEGLLVELLLVLDDFQRDVLPRLVVERLAHLPEAPASERREQLVAERDVVLHDDLVVALRVVEAVVVRAAELHRVHLARAALPAVVDLGEVLDLARLEGGQLRRVLPHGVLPRHTTAAAIAGARRGGRGGRRGRGGIAGRQVGGGRRLVAGRVGRCSGGGRRLWPVLRRLAVGHITEGTVGVPTRRRRDARGHRLARAAVAATAVEARVAVGFKFAHQ